MMQPSSFERFTHTLQQRLAADERVLALIALGSMAEPVRHDQWSDHDFWVITQPDCQEAFLSDLSWLPDASEIVLAFRQAVSYYTVLYRNGYTIEFAVFDAEQVLRAKTNRYSFLFDKANLAPRIQQLQEATVASLHQQHAAIESEEICTYFLLQLQTAVQRHYRGELLSSQQNIQAALNNLLFLIARYILPEDATMVDGFDNRRHFERSYPTIAGQIHEALQQAAPTAALHLLAIAESYVSAAIASYPHVAANVIRESIDRDL